MADLLDASLLEARLFEASLLEEDLLDACLLEARLLEAGRPFLKELSLCVVARGSRRMRPQSE